MENTPKDSIITNKTTTLHHQQQSNHDESVRSTKEEEDKVQKQQQKEEINRNNDVIIDSNKSLTTSDDNNNASNENNTDWIKKRSQIFQESLQKRVTTDFFLVRRYEDLYFNQKNFDTNNNNNSSNNSKKRLDPLDALALTHIPWRLKRNGEEKPTKTIVDSQKKNKQDCPFYMSWSSHLTLRHVQNTNWAEGRLEKGVAFAKVALNSNEAFSKLSLVKKAEACYKDGLGMIPDHPGLCVAYGALCANDGRLDEAKSMFLTALSNAPSSANDEGCNNGDGTGIQSSEIGAGVARLDRMGNNGCTNGDIKENEKSATSTTLRNARLYLAQVEKRLDAEAKTKKQKQSSLLRSQNRNDSPNKASSIMSNRAEKALQDAKTERDFLMGPLMMHDRGPSSSTAVTTSFSEKESRKTVMNKTYDLLEEPSPQPKNAKDYGKKNKERSARKKQRHSRRSKEYSSSSRRRRREKRRRKDDEGTIDNVDEHCLDNDSDDDESGQIQGNEISSRSRRDHHHRRSRSSRTGKNHSSHNSRRRKKRKKERKRESRKYRGSRSESESSSSSVSRIIDRDKISPNDT